MKNMLLPLLLITMLSKSFSQKIQGVYVGKFFSDRNALTLGSKDGQITGTLYINPTEHFDFIGTYAKPQLKGIISLDDTKKISVEGSLKENFLKILFLDSSEKSTRTLYKVSTKSNIDINDLFSEGYDMLLLGKWEQVKKIGSNGKDVLDGSLIYEYWTNGRGVKGLGIYSASYSIDWKTHNGQLNCKEHHPELSKLGFSDAIDYTLNYIIKNDTLITTKSTNKFIYYWKRK